MRKDKLSQLISHYKLEYDLPFINLLNVLSLNREDEIYKFFVKTNIFTNDEVEKILTYLEVDALEDISTFVSQLDTKKHMDINDPILFIFKKMFKIIEN
jgi:hypothetical protein